VGEPDRELGEPLPQVPLVFGRRLPRALEDLVGMERLALVE
jgi:hypothetical protein